MEVRAEPPSTLDVGDPRLHFPGLCWFSYLLSMYLPLPDPPLKRRKMTHKDRPDTEIADLFVA